MVKTVTKTFTVTDLRKGDVFPNVDYRFSTLLETDTEAVLERDFLGENPLHYYSDIKAGELIVANNIVDIKDYLEKQQRMFAWERVRAVSNNTRTTIDDLAFAFASPREEERGPTLQEYELQEPLNYRDITAIGKTVRKLLQKSLEARLSSISDQEIGLLLSGGLDSMSTGYLLSKAQGKKDRKITAFTLKVDENNLDVVKSRELAQRFSIDLTEVKIGQDASGLSITLQRYSPAREQYYARKIAEGIDLNEVILESLKISGNPKKDRGL